jgi:hypothetical protein
MISLTELILSGQCGFLQREVTFWGTLIYIDPFCSCLIEGGQDEHQRSNSKKPFDLIHLGFPGELSIILYLTISSDDKL